MRWLNFITSTNFLSLTLTSNANYEVNSCSLLQQPSRFLSFSFLFSLSLYSSQNTETIKMASSYRINCSTLLHLLMFLSSLLTSSANLSFNFYASSCSVAEFLVRNTVRSATSSDPTIPGKLLRLFFHDCFVQVTRTNYELLRKVQTIWLKLCLLVELARVVMHQCWYKGIAQRKAIPETHLLEDSQS